MANPIGRNLLFGRPRCQRVWENYPIRSRVDPRGRCITRYDCAHESPHRDVLGKKSTLIRKEFCENMSKEKAFQHAISDLKKNFERYIAYYESH